MRDARTVIRLAEIPFDFNMMTRLVVRRTVLPFTRTSTEPFALEILTNTRSGVDWTTLAVGWVATSTSRATVRTAGAVTPSTTTDAEFIPTPASGDNCVTAGAPDVAAGTVVVVTTSLPVGAVVSGA